LRNGCSRGPAAVAASVCRQTFWKWMKEDPDFRQTVEDAEHEAIKSMEDALFMRGLGSGKAANTAAIFWLKNKAGWRDVYDQRHSGEIRTSLTVHAQALQDTLSQDMQRQIKELSAEVESNATSG
jgi:hypothetical protein